MASIGMPRQYVILLEAEVIGSQKRSRLDGTLENSIRPRPNPASKANASATPIDTPRRRFVLSAGSSKVPNGPATTTEWCKGICAEPARVASAVAEFVGTIGSRNVGT